MAKQGKREYGRKDIHGAMKEATGYYKTSFQANLSQSLTNLVKQGDLLEVKKEIYALSVQKQKDLEGRLVSAPKT